MTTAPRWCCQKINLLTKKGTKSALNEKVCFFAFSHFNNFFGTHGHIPAILNFWDRMLSALSHSQSPQHFKTYLQSLETKPETHFFMPKSRKPFSLQLKRPKFCHFLGLKAVWRKNYGYKTQFFLEILKAVCLSVNWAPKLIQIFFPTMEQKLVQRCETEIVADACNAS